MKFAQTDYSPSFRYHGNYCGPGWSDGKYQKSVEGTKPAIDRLDKACQVHDKWIARGHKDLANHLFNKQANNWTTPLTPKEQLAKQTIHLISKMPNETNQRKKPRRFRVRKGPVNAPIPPKPKKRTSKRKRRSTASLPAVEYHERPAQADRIATSKNHARARGTIFLGSIGGTTTNKVGDILGRYPIHPSVVGDSSLRYLANCYEMWKVNKWKFVFDTSVGTASKGTLVMYHSPDPEDSAGTGVAAIRKALSANSKVSFPVWKAQSKALQVNPTQVTKLYTHNNPAHDDSRLAVGGTVYLLTMTTFPTNDTLGQMMLEYDVEFYQPMLESVAPISTAIQFMKNTTVDAASPWGSTDTWANRCTDSLQWSYYPGTQDFCRWDPPRRDTKYIVFVQFAGTGITTNPAFLGLNATVTMIMQSNTSNTYYMGLFTFEPGDPSFAPRLGLPLHTTWSPTTITEANIMFTPYIDWFGESKPPLTLETLAAMVNQMRLKGKEEEEKKSNQDSDDEIVVIKSKAKK